MAYNSGRDFWSVFSDVYVPLKDESFFISPKGLKSMFRLLHPAMQSVPVPLRRQVWARIAVCPQYRFLYVRIPKAANSTIVKTLVTHMSPASRERFAEDITGDLAKQSFDQLSYLRDFTVGSMLRRFYTFSFFRNPFTRLLSAYLDKVQSPFSSRNYTWIAQSMNTATTREISFEQFVSFLENHNLYANIHWAPQVRICPFPVEQLDFVGKVEQLDTDLARVIHSVFGPNTFQGLVTREHNRQHASDKVGRYYTSQDIIARVAALYHEDFSRLGYALDLPES